MNEEEQNQIKVNLDFLAQNTSNTVQLLNLLEARKLISHVERQVVCSKPTEYEQFSDLYIALTKKGNDAFKQLLICLEKSGNDTIANKIRAKTAASKNDTDFIWFNVKSPTKFYKGRQNDIQIIQDCYKETFRSRCFMLVGITGLGGIGKSELAKNYAKKFYEDTKGHCVWINAETNQSIFESFKKLATKLGIPVKNSSGNEKSLETLLPDIYDNLCEEKCLFIFDNLECYEETSLTFLVDDALGRPPTKLKPFVISTSRYKLVSDSFGCLATHIELNCLSEDAATSFFIDALGLKENNEEVLTNVKKLCQILNCFPLAMQQAAAYINAKKRNSDVNIEVKNYVDSFDKQSKNLLEYRLPKMLSLGLDEASRATYLTWQITLDKIEKLPGVGLKATNVLKIISFLDSENIHTNLVQEFLETIFPEDSNIENKFKKEKVDVFEILDTYSMCHKMRSEEKCVVSVHRLVQEVIRIKLEEEDKLMDFLNNLLQCINAIFESGKYPLTELLHTEIVWKHARKYKDLVEKHCSFPCTIAKLYIDNGQLRQANMFINEANENLLMVLGRENRATLKMTFWEGEVLVRLGDYKKGREILSGVYEEQKRIFSECDDDCLITAGRIGSAHWRLGHYDEAMTWMTDVIEIRKRINTEENQELLGLQNDLALVHSAQGNFDDAMTILRQVLEVKERILGSEHESTLTTKNNISSQYYRQGNYQEALKMIEEVWKTTERMQGKKHPDTLVSQNNFGRVLLAQGKYEESLKMLEEVLALRNEILGTEHPHTLLTKYHCGSVKIQQGFLKEGLEILQEVYEVEKKVLGENHPDALHSKEEINSIRKKIETVTLQ